MPLTILVAEDDLGTRLSLSDFLEISGYMVVSAENGQKALEMVDEYRPHLIVTDLAMPLMDGYELIRRVRLNPQFRLLPVVFLTERNTRESRIRGYQMGCDVFLPKPFDLEELGAVIRNLVERSQLIQSEWRSQSPTADLPLDMPPEPKPKGVGFDEIPFFDLTDREKDVLALLSNGLSNAQIGDRLHLSPRTVEKYVSNLLRKSETNNRAELVRFAMEHHLVG